MAITSSIVNPSLTLFLRMRAILISGAQPSTAGRAVRTECTGASHLHDPGRTRAGPRNCRAHKRWSAIGGKRMRKRNESARENTSRSDSEMKTMYLASRLLLTESRHEGGVNIDEWKTSPKQTGQVSLLCYRCYCLLIFPKPYFVRMVDKQKWNDNKSERKSRHRRNMRLRRFQ